MLTAFMHCIRNIEIVIGILAVDPAIGTQHVTIVTT
jgi:hypothetical protein